MLPKLLFNSGAFVVRAMLSMFKHIRGHRLPVKSHGHAKVAFIEDPAKDFKPSNPKWLIQGAHWTPDTIPAEFLVEPPPLAEFKAAVAAGKLDFELGSQECREALFSLQQDFCYLNHGSYGATYTLALKVQSWYRQQLEREPVRFMETEGLAALVHAVADVAGFVGADWRDVVPVSNATTGVNAVLHSLELQRGDLILMTNATYPAVRSTMAHTTAAAGAGLLELKLEVQDLQDEELLLAAFSSAISAGGKRLKLAVLDLIVSFPPVIMPVQRLCKMFSNAGVPVLVDGAHSIGALPNLKVPDLGCSFFVSTLHKWLCTPKGAAMLWVHPSKQHLVHPCVVSHGYELGYRAEFLWQGTADFTAWLAAPACLEVQQALQPQRITRYNHSLVKQATDMLLQAWGTQLALGISADGSTAGLVAIQLPWPLAIPRNSSSSSSNHGDTKPLPIVAVNGVIVEEGSEAAGPSDVSLVPTAEDASALNLLLRKEYKIEVPVACVGEMLLVRISAQIYNKMSDYEQLRDAVLHLAAAAR